MRLPTSRVRCIANNFEHRRIGMSGLMKAWYRTEPDRPFTLPPGEYKPKQSLGQNFLSDQNIIRNIVGTFIDDSEGGSRVVELGPGSGALTRVLYKQYPEMTAVEIDRRSVKFLGEKLPGLRMIQMDVLDTDWAALAVQRHGKLNLIGNLPFNISSQIMFSLIDQRFAIQRAVFTNQLEVAKRIVAVPRSKEYGILSIAFQLYTRPTFHFVIPSKAFYPAPKVQGGLVSLDFTKPHRNLDRVRHLDLRRVVVTSFGKRRKMLRASLKSIIEPAGIVLPEKWATRRPEELKPQEFLELTADLYGEVSPADLTQENQFRDLSHEDIESRNSYRSCEMYRNPSGAVWRGVVL